MENNDSNYGNKSWDDNKSTQTNQPYNSQNSGGSNQRPYYERENIPQASTSLTVGIVGVVLFFILCWCYGIIAPLTLIAGIIGLVISNKGLRQYRENPERYNPSSLSNLNIGKVLNIVNIVLSGLVTLLLLIGFIIFGTAILNQDWDKIREEIENNQNKEYYEDDSYYEDDAEDGWYEYEEEADSLNTVQDSIIVEETP